MSNLFNVGQIINTHGIKGEVKVQRITDFPERFSNGHHLFLDTLDDGIKKLTIDGHRMHKGFDLLHFESYDNINDVEHFKGHYLKINEDQLTELEENEFYYHEIIGCHVYLTNGDYAGEISEILTPGANDVWVVKQKNGQEILVPYIKDVVTNVDIHEKIVIIEPMEGLLE